MNLEALLAPRESTPPSGENLEYDDVFVAMEIAARPVEERQAGETILDAADPDFADVARKALGVLERSHDLRAGVTLAGALLFTRGLPGFGEATGYIRGCLEQFWDSCHPQLDPDDDDDPTMRINSLQALSAPDLILRGLRAAPLTESRAFGRVSLRDIQIATGQVALPEGESPQHDSAGIAAAFRDTAPESVAEVLKGAREALANLQAIDRIFVERTPGAGPRLAEPMKLLQQIVQQVASATDSAVDLDTVDETGDGPDQGSFSAAGGGHRTPGRIASPADVRAALDAVIAYYQKNEPSSPVPLLIDRAKRLVGADFMSILSELAPQGVDNVKLIGGLQDEESY